MITLQYCDGFCHVSVWIGHRYTRVPSILSSSPTSLPTLALQVVIEHWLWVPGFIHQTRTGYIYFICSNAYISVLFLKSSCLRLLPLSSDICSLHLCLLCCPVCRIIGTIFPYTEHNDLTYMHLEMTTSFVNIYHLIWASLITQVVKNPPAMQKTTVQFLGWEDPLEKG